MPGLIGIVSPRDAEAFATDRLAAAEAAMPGNPSWERRSWRSREGDCEMTCFARGNPSSSVIQSIGSSTIAFDGEIFGLDVPKERQGGYLLERFIQGGIESLKTFEGRFVAAIWANETQQLTLLTDKFASKPLYHAISEKGIAFGTSVNAVKQSLIGSEGMNLDGIIQFFTFGHLWNDDTFYESIKVAFPASCIEYNAKTKQVKTSQYWRPSSSQRLPHDESLELLSNTLAESVVEQSRDTPGLGVALSGGLDARTMLALVETDKIQPACVSLGMEGSLDQRTASKLAELAGCPFHPLILGEGFLENFRQHMERMVQLTDGHYLSQCIVMPTFPLYESLGIEVLLRGHVGELLHMHKAYNFSVDDEFSSVNSDASLKDWLWTHLQSHLTAGVPEPLLKNVDADTFTESGRRSLDLSLQATDHFDQPLDRLSQLFLDQRTRRETAMSLVKFSSVADPRLPYLDSRFITAVFATDPVLRIDEDIQSYILRTRRPEFLKPANSNTGAPVGVSAMRRQLSYYRMRILAKLGVKGYQPYERLGLWLKRELRPLVESILLDPRCLDRGLFNPECVRSVVHRHMEGQANHTYLIMAMMVMETGFSSAEMKHNESLPTTAASGSS